MLIIVEVSTPQVIMIIPALGRIDGSNNDPMKKQQQEQHQI
jgi:hypothetical protein